MISYVDKDSLFHRLDPRSKLVWLLLLTLSVFYIDRILALLFVFALLLGLAIISKVASRSFLRQTGIWIMVLIIGLFALSYWQLGQVYDSFLSAIEVTFRLLIMIDAALIFMMTTNPQHLIAGLVKWRTPRPIAFTFGLGVRMLPVIVAEANKIIVAQQSRGFDSRVRLANFHRLPRILTPLLIPFFVCIVKSADDIALSLEAKGFTIDQVGRTTRTRMKWIDYAVMCAMAIYFVVIYILRF